MNGSEKISYTTSQRVRYAETDAMGVVYYGDYFTFFEVGRVELLRSRGHSYRDLENEGVLMPVVEATCKYIRPLRFDDLVNITATVGEIGRARVSFDYRIADAEDNLLAEGRTLHACVNLEGKPVRIKGILAKALDLDNKNK
ncbi:MAG: acyl-CoA thioesterase [bacterium]|nr:acyl-CoA thioesterase [bacterium]